MLLQGCYGHEFFASLCSAPIFEKLRHMQGYPFPDQAKSPGWQAAFQQGRAIDCQACPILTVLSMEMRRRVIRPVHPDDDAVEGADPRHEPEDMSRVRIVELWWTRGDSNPWPRECDSRALPTELRAHAKRNRQYATTHGTAGLRRPVHILATMAFLFKTKKLPEGVDPSRIPPGQTLTAPDRWPLLH